MRLSMRIVAVITAAVAIGLPAAPASARKHCKSGSTLKHNKCVKKAKKHTGGTPQTPIY